MKGARVMTAGLWAGLLLAGCDSGADGLIGGGLTENRDMNAGAPMTEPTSLADLQVQPPEAIAYEEAKPGDIRVLPKTLFCTAEFVSEPLRDTLSLQDDVGFSGPIAASFDRFLEQQRIPTARGSETTYRGAGVSQGTLEQRRRSYRERCAWTPENIYIDLAIGMNAASEPYRIELTIRQADKQWRRVVERLEGRRPDITDFPPYRVGPKALAEVSIAKDVNELSTEVSELLSNRYKA